MGGSRFKHILNFCFCWQLKFASVLTCFHSHQRRMINHFLCKGRFRPLKKFGKFGSTSRSVLVHFHIVESWNWKVGKLGKHAPAAATPRYTVLSRFTAAKENKDRSAQSVQDEASLSPAATRAGFSSPPRPQISIAHGIRSVTLGHD